MKRVQDLGDSSWMSTFLLRADNPEKDLLGNKVDNKVNVISHGQCKITVTKVIRLLGLLTEGCHRRCLALMTTLLEQCVQLLHP